MAYALRILKNVGLPCEGITTPGGFGNRALPELAQATAESVRDVFGRRFRTTSGISTTAAKRAWRRASNTRPASTAPIRAAS